MNEYRLQAIKKTLLSELVTNIQEYLLKLKQSSSGVITGNDTNQWIKAVF